MSTKTTLWPPFQRRAAPPPHPPVIFTGRALQGAAPLTVERKMVVLETTPLDKDELGRRRGERGTSPTNTHTGARERGPQCPRASTPIGVGGGAACAYGIATRWVPASVRARPRVAPWINPAAAVTGCPEKRTNPGYRGLRGHYSAREPSRPGSWVLPRRRDGHGGSVSKMSPLPNRRAGSAFGLAT